MELAQSGEKENRVVVKVMEADASCPRLIKCKLPTICPCECIAISDLEICAFHALSLQHLSANLGGSTQSPPIDLFKVWASLS